MHLIDHKNDVSGSPDLIHDLFEPFLKLAPILGARHQQANIQADHPLFHQDIGHIPLNDPLGQAFRNSSFAHSRLANQHRVVFGTATQDLHHPLDLVLATHHGIQLAVVS